MGFLADLSDADLLVRPVPGANHIAWQLGHLILSERHMGSQIPGVKYPDLPPGFDKQHGKEACGLDTGFASKSQYQALFEAGRMATLEAAGRLSEADLDRPTEGQVAKYAPTVGKVLILISTHDMMHGGQFTVIRRKLGKPVLF
jgi:uncharacterized damage-inducible protein DinB